MKVALVVPGGVDRSGSERVIPCLLWLIERLVRAGDEVKVYALDQEPEPGRWHLLGAEVCNAGRGAIRLRTIMTMMREHRRGSFNVVHAFWAGAPGQTASLFGALSGVPVVVTLPGGDLVAIPDIAYGAQLTVRGRLTTKAVLSRAAAIVAPSVSTARQVGDLGFPARVIPFGVALDRWPPSPPRRRDRGAILRLLHVASLNRVKDQSTLLKAMALLADEGVDFRLDIIGEDTLGGAVQQLAARLRLDRQVEFHGFVPNAEVRSWFEQTDLLVMSSRHETGPIVMLEAAVAGVPTIGTNVGTIADWAPEAALTVPVGDSKMLAEAITELARNEEKRFTLTTAAHKRALAHDADRYAAEIRNLYAEVVARSPLPAS